MAKCYEHDRRPLETCISFYAVYERLTNPFFGFTWVYVWVPNWNFRPCLFNIYVELYKDKTIKINSRPTIEGSNDILITI